MAVDISGWKEDPARNKSIADMSLAPTAPVANVAAMVATLMAAIKGTDAGAMAAIGDLALLTTTEKGSLVGAVNELEAAKADSTHTHVGTEVTLTGYSKASAASAVNVTDTANDAIGKLEKALDDKADATPILPAQIDSLFV